MPLPKGPYDAIPLELKSKVQAMVPTEDKLFLQSIFPERGILLFITESVLHAIVNDIKTHGITHYTPDNAAAVLAFVRQRTNPELTHSGRVQAESGPAQGVCHQTPDIEVLSADLHESSSGRVGRSGREETKEKGKRKGGNRKGSKS